MKLLGCIEGFVLNANERAVNRDSLGVMVCYLVAEDVSCCLNMRNDIKSCDPFAKTTLGDEVKVTTSD